MMHLHYFLKSFRLERYLGAAIASIHQIAEKGCSRKPNVQETQRRARAFTPRPACTETSLGLVLSTS
jgi:hypothetical protein